MKFFLFLSAILIFAVNGHSQTYFKFIEENGEDVYGGLGEIVQDGNLSFAGLVKKGTEKIYTYVTWENNDNIDFNTDYFLTLNLKNYLPVWINVDLQKKDTLTIHLELDKNIVKEKKGNHFNICGEPIYIKYTPRTFRSWEEIPENARKKIVSTLEGQLGKKNFDKLYISSGYILNGPEMQKAGVKRANNQIVYRMCLSFSDPKKGIDQYSTFISFTDTGEILNYPDFPRIEFWNLDDVWSFRGLKELQNIASIAGYFIKDETTSTFNFYPRQNTFVWEFTTVQGKTERGEIKERTSYYDAITGELVAIFYDTKIVLVN
jgi:hypothetical protein